MPKFEPKYVRFMWSAELEGKMVFFADSISYLKERVENNNSMYYGEVVQVENYRPFQMAHGQEPWTFCYYDPYYELKWAHEQGMTIQAHVSGNMWVNIKEPSWEDRPECYRIKPGEPKESKPITNRELSKWLAQGNGEYCWYDDEDGFVSKCLIELRYFQENANEKVVRVKIRKWEDSEWHKPSRQYMGLEE